MCLLFHMPEHYWAPPSEAAPSSLWPTQGLFSQHTSAAANGNVDPEATHQTFSLFVHSASSRRPRCPKCCFWVRRCPIRMKIRITCWSRRPRCKHPPFKARKLFPQSIPAGIRGPNLELKIRRRQKMRAKSPRGAGLMMQSVNNCDYSSLMKGLGTSIDYQFKLTNNLAWIKAQQ